MAVDVITLPEGVEYYASGSGGSLTAYAKFNSGLLICWGGIPSYNASSSASNTNVTFAYPFIDIQFAIMISAANNSAGGYDNAKMSYYNEATTGFTARAINSDGRLPNGKYIAVGRWK